MGTLFIAVGVLYVVAILIQMLSYLQTTRKTTLKDAAEVQDAHHEPVRC